MTESGEWIGHEAKGQKNHQAAATLRGHDARIVFKTEPAEASVQVVSAVSLKFR